MGPQLWRLVSPDIFDQSVCFKLHSTGMFLYWDRWYLCPDQVDTWIVRKVKLLLLFTNLWNHYNNNNWNHQISQVKVAYNKRPISINLKKISRIQCKVTRTKLEVPISSEPVPGDPKSGQWCPLKISTCNCKKLYHCSH